MEERLKILKELSKKIQIVGGLIQYDAEVNVPSLVEKLFDIKSPFIFNRSTKINYGYLYGS